MPYLTKAQLLAKIDSYVYTNENGEITAESMNEILKDLLNYSGDEIHIPKLQVMAKMYYDYETPENADLHEKFRVKWVSRDLRFLDYNPEVWLFLNRRGRRIKSYSGDDPIRWLDTRGWKHPPHLNGSKYANSAFYSGGDRGLPAWLNGGRHTEFICGAVSDAWFTVPVDYYEWFYGWTSETGKFQLTDANYSTVDGDNNGVKWGAFGHRNGIQPFRLAIVIDNPDPAARNPKVIGQMSDPLVMRFKSNHEGGGKRFMISSMKN